MKTKIALALVALAAPTAVHAETWQVTEGPQGKITGVWTVATASGVTGTARMTAPNGQTVTYDVRGQMKDGAYALQRANASDKVDCLYFGRPVDGKIAGSAHCNGETTPWTATKQN